MKIREVDTSQFSLWFSLSRKARGRVGRDSNETPIVIPVVTFLTPLAEQFSDLKDR